MLRSRSHSHFDIRDKDAKGTHKNILDLIKENHHRTPAVSRALINHEIDRLLYDKSFQLTSYNRKYAEDFFQFLAQYDPDAAGRVLLDNIKHRSKPELNEILIKFGATLDVRDRSHGTALFYALLSNKDLSLMLSLAKHAKSNSCVGKYKVNGHAFDISLLEVAALCSSHQVLNYLALTFNDQIAVCVKNLENMQHDFDHIEMNKKNFGWLDINFAIDRLIYFAKTKEIEPYISFEYISRHVEFYTLSFHQSLGAYQKLANNISFATSRCHCISLLFWRRSYSEKALHLLETAQKALLKKAGDSKDHVKTLLDHPVFDPVHNQFGVDSAMRQALMDKSKSLGLGIETEFKKS